MKAITASEQNDIKKIAETYKQADSIGKALIYGFVLAFASGCKNDCK